MKKSIILIDADDTLFDFHRSEKEALFNTLRHFGMEPSDEKHESYMRINDENWKALERGEFTKDEIVVRRFAMYLDKCEKIAVDPLEMHLFYHDELSKLGYLYPTAEPFLKEMKRRGKRVFLITNGLIKVQNGRLDDSGLRKYLDGVFISDAVGYEKPDLRYFEYVASRIENFERSEAVVIGDSLTSDMRGAVNFGLDRIWVNRKNKTADISVNATVKDLDEIPAIID